MTDYSASDLKAHARWLRDAIAASKEATARAKTYDALEDMKAPDPKRIRGLKFHESESGTEASVFDAIVDAMKWSMPPDEFRVYAHAIELVQLQREIDQLREKAASEERQRKSIQASLEIVLASRSDDGEDPDDYD